MLLINRRMKEEILCTIKDFGTINEFSTVLLEQELFLIHLRDTGNKSTSVLFERLNENYLKKIHIINSATLL